MHIFHGCLEDSIKIRLSFSSCKSWMTVLTTASSAILLGNIGFLFIHGDTGYQVALISTEKNFTRGLWWLSGKCVSILWSRNHWVCDTYFPTGLSILVSFSHYFSHLSRSWVDRESFHFLCMAEVFDMDWSCHGTDVPSYASRTKYPFQLEFSSLED